MLKILDLYIARTLLSTTTLTLAVLIGLSALIKFVEQLRRVGQGDYDMTVAALYVLLSLPREVELFLPMATLLGGLIGIGMLAQSSELVVMQASGMSRFQITLSACKSIVLIIIAIMAVSEFVTPESESKAKEIRTQALSGGSILSSESVTWAKDGNNFVSISDVIDENNLQDIQIYMFDEELTIEKILSASQASYTGSNWNLSEVVILTFTNSKIHQEHLNAYTWDSTLTPDRLGIDAVKPEALSIQGLLEYVDYLENNQQDASRYELALWRKITQPFSVIVMLLLAMSFIFGPLRSVTMGARIIMGVIAGFSFYICNEVFGQISLVFQLTPVFGAILPSLVFAGITVFLLKR
ncbi:LPS export ABC transporter permease LptG [Agaribacter flavus]|uniref:LPS export ABC transporter permease LptG n=1 Tax=Agaribacter flavus TaxID=1902781 RepID=A0ABV7FWZ8_9ALTE